MTFKPWYKKRKVFFTRKKAFREVRNKFLIVCEGEKTEPNYFSSFPINKNIVTVDICDAKCVAVSVVEKAIELKESANRDKKPYNQIWCVFDRDSNPADPNSATNFNKAIQLARKQGIGVAYSNQAFELWYILHFEYLQAALTRDRYIEKLTALLGRKYEKNCLTMYAELKQRQKQAITFAEKLLQSHANYNPEANDPSTTVHYLVKEINKFLE
ncbi:MAG: RloB family protein [Candidatus Omnitrophica bacterium]|nr:RloB family protein [Candidatus Omnitrophota bacterium]